MHRSGQLTRTDKTVNAAASSAPATSPPAASFKKKAFSSARSQVEQPEVGRKGQQYDPIFGIKPKQDSSSGGRLGISYRKNTIQACTEEDAAPHAETATEIGGSEEILCTPRRNGSKGETIVKDGVVYTLETAGRKPCESLCELSKTPMANTSRPRCVPSRHSRSTQ